MARSPAMRVERLMRIGWRGLAPLIRCFQRAAQAADDDTARTVIAGCRNAAVDVEHEFRHLVVPIELCHSFRRKAASMRDIAQGGDGRRQVTARAGRITGILYRP
jgi:hypothetical protein